MSPARVPSDGGVNRSADRPHLPRRFKFTHQKAPQFAARPDAPDPRSPVPPSTSADDTTGSTQASELGAANPQHTVVDGGGAYPHDSNGVPWSGSFITASGNLMADFHLNATAEMQGRLQVARLFHMTDDRGMKELIRFLVTRDHLHQMQWISAIEELKADGLDGLPVPEAFPLGEEFEEFSHTFIQASDGDAALEGRWASGPAPDGRGDFQSALIAAHGEHEDLAPGDPGSTGPTL